MKVFNVFILGNIVCALYFTVPLDSTSDTMTFPAGQQYVV